MTFQQRAPFVCAFCCPFIFFFIILAFAFYSGHVLAKACAQTEIDEWVDLEYVIDGDTIHLKDGRSVRLIGVNAPELARKNRNAEPFAIESKKSLAKLLMTTKKIGLSYGQEKLDRYLRTLAHVFLANGVNVQASQLQNGMAAHIIIPPNIRQQNCYAKHEKNARSKGLGIWSNARFQKTSSDKLSNQSKGFYFISGRVHEIKQNNKTIWLFTDEKFAFRIEKDDLPYFKKLRPFQLLGQKIAAKGWIFPYKNQLNMRIKHSAAIEIN